MILEKWNADAKEIIRKFSKREMCRLDTIIAMHIMVCNMNNESAYMAWICLVPDCANEWDFIDFAKDEDGTTENQLFDEAVALFMKLWKNYAVADGGLYIGDKCYKATNGDLEGVKDNMPNVQQSDMQIFEAASCIKGKNNTKSAEHPVWSVLRKYKYIEEIEEIAEKCTISQSDGYSQIMRICEVIKEEQ